MDFVRTRLAPANIPNDGKQTPMRGHPVFVAQHACACCCRGCLFKWYKVPQGRELTEEEQRRIVNLLMAWIEKEMELLAEYLVEGKDIRTNEMIEKHADWAEGFVEKYDIMTAENVMGILEQEIGKVFVGVLEDAGVFKSTKEGREAFKKFISTL